MSRALSSLTAWLRSREGASPVLAGGFWLLLGGGFSRGCTLLAQITIARELGKAAFGSWSLVVNTVLFFSLCVSSGLAIAATKQVAELREKDLARSGRIVTLILAIAGGAAVVGGMLCVLSGRWIAETVYRTPQLAAPLW